jgi:hypothetical protein
MSRPLGSLIAVVAIAFGLASTATATPIVTLTETVDPVPPGCTDCLAVGHYTVSAGDLEGNVIVGFAVDNSVSQIALTGRPGWQATVVTDLVWNGGYVFTFNRFWEGVAETSKSTGPGGDFKSMDSVWPGANQANVFWLARDDGFPIVSFEEDDRFIFFPAVPQSTLLLFMQAPNGDIFASNTAAPIPAPEPGSLAVFGVVLASLIGARRRRRGRAPGWTSNQRPSA